MGLTHSPSAFLEQKALEHSVPGPRFLVLFFKSGPLPFGLVALWSRSDTCTNPLSSSEVPAGLRHVDEIKLEVM